MKTDEITIYLPIKIEKSKFYFLVFTDRTGMTHYFNEDGSYDGWSRNCDRNGECFMRRPDKEINKN